MTFGSMPKSTSQLSGYGCRYGSLAAFQFSFLDISILPPLPVV